MKHTNGKHAELVTNIITQLCGADYKPAEYWDIFYEPLRKIRMVGMHKHADISSQYSACYESA